jgi:hypothetical protein
LLCFSSANLVTVSLSTDLMTACHAMAGVCAFRILRSSLANVNVGNAGICLLPQSPSLIARPPFLLVRRSPAPSRSL